MAAERLIAVIVAWTCENSARGRIAKAFFDNVGNDPRMQAERLSTLGSFAEQQIRRTGRLSMA
jgi:hypothetical protein